jgi:hypothetical protein
VKRSRAPPLKSEPLHLSNPYPCIRMVASRQHLPRNSIRHRFRTSDLFRDCYYRIRVASFLDTRGTSAKHPARVHGPELKVNQPDDEHRARQVEAAPGCRRELSDVATGGRWPCVEALHSGREGCARGDGVGCHADLGFHRFCCLKDEGLPCK